MIDCVDQNIGRLVSKLKEMRAYEDTLLLFLSDNGGCPFQRTRPATRDKKLSPWDPESYWTYDKGWAHASNTPFRLYKRNQHEGGISTPLIAHWPRGIKHPGTNDDHVGHLVDIMPTCLDLAGVTYPTQVRGKPLGSLRGESLAPLLAGQRRDHDRELYFQFGNNVHRALRQGDWKIVAHDSGDWELYHVVQDRTELNDLAAQYPDRRQAMVAKWQSLHREVGGTNQPKQRKRNKSKPGAAKSS